MFCSVLDGLLKIAQHELLLPLWQNTVIALQLAI